MLTKTQNNLKLSKIDLCPNCFRRLNKRVAVEDYWLVYFKHRGAELYASEINIKCLGCGKWFIVSGQDGIIEEAKIGRD